LPVHVGLDIAEAPREGELLFRREVLAAKINDAVSTPVAKPLGMTVIESVAVRIDASPCMNRFYQLAVRCCGFRKLRLGCIIMLSGIGMELKHSIVNFIYIKK
jgi:hypothetical protein